MSGITCTAPTSATQRAVWTHEASEGVYSAAVTLSSDVDERGARGWAYELGFTPSEGVGFRYTFARPSELIFSWDSDPRRVLATLASFVGAWDEAQRYPGSENADLFPAICAPFLGAADVFGADTSDFGD